jgi:hypothetical protein
MDAECTNLFALMKAEKTRAVKRSTEGEVHDFVDVYARGRRQLRVGTTGADETLGVIYSAAPIFGADRLVVAVDAWHTKRQTNPVTGATWKLGEMGKLVRDDAGLDRGLVDEGIEVMSLDRDGNDALFQMLYDRDRGARTITWSEPEPLELGGGRFLHVAREAFARPTALDIVLEQVGPPPESVDLDALLDKMAVTWALALPHHFRILESPKGPPLGAER